MRLRASRQAIPGQAFAPAFTLWTTISRGMPSLTTWRAWDGPMCSDGATPMMPPCRRFLASTRSAWIAGTLNRTRSERAIRGGPGGFLAGREESGEASGFSWCRSSESSCSCSTSRRIWSTCSGVSRSASMSVHLCSVIARPHPHLRRCRCCRTRSGQWAVSQAGRASKPSSHTRRRLRRETPGTPGTASRSPLHRRSRAFREAS
jgi:hypothetical protein